MQMLNIASWTWTHHSKRTQMTINDDGDDDNYEFREKLNVYRNKVEMLLRHALDSVVDAIISGNDPILPISTRRGSLEFSKCPDKFGNKGNSIKINRVIL